MTGRAKMPALVPQGGISASLQHKRQKVFMPAIKAPHPGKPQMQITAVQIPVNHVPDIGPEKPVLPLIAIVPGHFQVFEMILPQRRGTQGNYRGLLKLRGGRRRKRSVLRLFFPLSEHDPDRYHATAVKTDDHLIRCGAYTALFEMYLIKIQQALSDNIAKIALG